jgi:hypothetical protein
MLGIGPEHGFVGLARPVFVKTRTLGLLLRALREIAAARRLLPRRLQVLRGPVDLPP